MAGATTDIAHTLGLGAQARAADPAVSAWVSANAGTGKTRVLTDRVARLLLAGTDPQRLLCLTFTRAAAAEMQERLFARLGRWATLADAPLGAELVALGHADDAATLAAARRLFARALDIPGGLKIQTIHAFCEGLLKRFPVEAGVPAQFTVLDEGQAGALVAAARARVLGAARNGPLAAALGFIAEVAEEPGFRGLLDELVAKRSSIARMRARHGGDAGLSAAIRALLGVAPVATAQGILAEGCAAPAVPEAALRRAAAALEQGGAGDRATAARLHAFLGATDRPAGFDAYRAAFLTATGAPRARLVTKAARAADPAVADILLAEQDRVGALSARLRAAIVAQATEAALALGGSLIDAYAEEKARRAALDYEDLILKARDLLGERADASWILSKLDGGIDHVLIDEAQDTSPEQWEVVQALTEEFFAGEGARPMRRTVFAVGDEKQSIYGFQGADPHAFGRMRAFFEERVRAARHQWRDEALSLSFRSAPDILRAVDLVFARPEAHAGLSLSGRPIMHGAFRAAAPGLVEIWPTIRPEPHQAADPWLPPADAARTAAPAVRLAARIADTIAGWLREGAVLAPGGPPVRPGGILILVRRRNIFVDAMVQALKQRGVPVGGADRLDLTGQLAVQDLIALGRCLLQPDDDLTLAAVLRGPLIGLDEAALFDLAHGRADTLRVALEKAADAGQPDAARARGFLAEAAARAGAAPFDFYADVLGPLGGRRALTARLGPQANDPLDTFLDAALRHEALEPPSLEGFLHAIEADAPEIRRDHEHGRDEVRVMTVHGAKGLEADIVFLADTCAVPTARHDPKLIPAGPDETLLLWPARVANDTPESAAGRAAARRARDAEHRRLLYVAMTRARDRLYVCGYETAGGRRKGCWYDLIADALAPLCRQVERGYGAPALRLGAGGAP